MRLPGAWTSDFTWASKHARYFGPVPDNVLPVKILPFQYAWGCTHHCTSIPLIDAGRFGIIISARLIWHPIFMASPIRQTSLPGTDGLFLYRYQPACGTSTESRSWMIQRRLTLPNSTPLFSKVVYHSPHQHFHPIGRIRSNGFFYIHTGEIAIQHGDDDQCLP